MISRQHLATSRVTIYASLTILAVITASITGCSGDPIMVHKSVPKTRVLDESAMEVDAEPKYRMITAIAERDSGTWFFKIGDTIEAIDRISPSWVAFLESIKFGDDDQPSWKLPEGWREGQGSAMRFATLIATSESTEAEVAVSSLPPRQNLLDNVNRWRGQLGLGRLGPVQLADNLGELNNGEVAFKIFDAKGPTYSAGMRGPFAGGSSGAPFAKSPMAKSSSLENPALLPFDFEKPEGWIDGETSSVVVTHWTKNIDGKTVEISILNMNPSDEAWKMNLQAWGNQIGLKEKPDIENLTENIEVSETSAKRIRLDAEGNDQEPGRTVVAVMFAAKEAGWLIKFFGESSLVDESMLEFEKFLESIEIH